MALGRVDESGRAEPDYVGLIVRKFFEKALGNRYRLRGRGNGSRMKPTQRLAAQIQPARIDTSRTDGRSDDVESAGVDGHGNAGSPGPAGLSRVLLQQPLVEQFRHKGANRVWTQLGPLVQLPTAERPFVAENSQNSTLMRGQDWLFITEHDRKVAFPLLRLLPGS